MIEARNLVREYRRGERSLIVLQDINFRIDTNEFVSITGPSGSGKSTLLGLLAGLDRPTRGEVLLDGHNLNEMNETELSVFRGSRIGFVFQNFQLVPTLTALENVSLPLRLQGAGPSDERAPQMLARVGLEDRLNHYPTQLSGGEMQRVAIARASVISPSILFADEPTGNLDSGSGDRVIELLMELRNQCTLVLVTHNPALASLADREIRLMDGKIHEIVDPGRSGRKGRSVKGRSSGKAGKKKSAAPAGRTAHSDGPARKETKVKVQGQSSGKAAAKGKLPDVSSARSGKKKSGPAGAASRKQNKGISARKSSR